MFVTGTRPINCTSVLFRSGLAIVAPSLLISTLVLIYMAPTAATLGKNLEETELSRWVSANGGSISGVEVRTLADGSRGIFATRDLDPGEYVVELPRKLLMTGDVARAAPHVAAVLADAQVAGAGEAIGELAASDPGTTAIVLFLLSAVARRGSTPGKDWVGCEAAGVDWAPWLDSLPALFETPATVSEKRLSASLEGSMLFEFAKPMRAELRVIFDKFVVPFAVEKYPKAFPPDKSTYDAFLWAFAVTESRAFGFDEDAPFVEDGETGASADSRGKVVTGGNDSLNGDSNGDSYTVLTPFADMMNHSCQPENVSIVVRLSYAEGDVHNTEMKGFQMVVKSFRVLSGEQLYISYGLLDNSRLLLHYGFASDLNPQDRIPLSLVEPDDSAPELYTKKLILLEMACPGRLRMDFQLTPANPLPEEAIASLRLLLMSSEDAEGVSRHTDFFRMLNVRNEQDVLAYLDGVATQLLVTSPAQPGGECVFGESSYERSCETYIRCFNSIAMGARAKVKSAANAAGLPTS